MMFACRCIDQVGSVKRASVRVLACVCTRSVILTDIYYTPHFGGKSPTKGAGVGVGNKERAGTVRTLNQLGRQRLGRTVWDLFGISLGLFVRDYFPARVGASIRPHTKITPSSFEACDGDPTVGEAFGWEESFLGVFSGKRLGHTPRSLALPVITHQKTSCPKARQRPSLDCAL